MSEPSCGVIKCQRPIGGMWTVDYGGIGPIEFVVCTEHGQDLADGADFRLDDEERTIIMGAELAALHQWHVADLKVTHSARQPDAKVSFSLKRLGTDETQEVDLYVNGKFSDALIEGLTLGENGWTAPLKGTWASFS